jgi:hypothetical protein
MKDVGNPSEEKGHYPALEAIGRLRGVTWTWGADAPEEARAQPPIGVIAQEVEDVFPQLVETDDAGHKRVYYEGLIAPLIEAVKELTARIEALDRQTR